MADNYEPDACACGAVTVLTRTGFGLFGDDVVHAWSACVAYRHRLGSLRSDLEDRISQYGAASHASHDSSAGGAT